MNNMKRILISTVILVLMALWFLNRNTYHVTRLLISYRLPFGSLKTTLDYFNANTILRDGNGILLMETTDRIKPSSLVLCALESAARVYPDRPVVFFMKGLGDILTYEDEKRTKEHFPILSFFHNIYLYPLKMDELFNNTPLVTWFQKVNPKVERYWTHIISDACRLAMIWKYGGIYMDTDVISKIPIPDNNFVAGQKLQYISNGLFGFSRFHSLTWQFMENFVQNYRGEIWGHQGPSLFTRVLNKMCNLPLFNTMNDETCANIQCLHPQRFYPIPYAEWRRYFEVYKEMPTFSNSYGLHLWNFMNNVNKTMSPGSNTLVEHLYKQHCPTTYSFILGNNKTYL